MLVLVAGGVREELQRAFLLHRFDQHLGGARVGVVVTSLAFGLGHTLQGWDAAVVTGLLGAFWGVIYVWRRNVIPTIVSHALFNVGEVLLAITALRSTAYAARRYPTRHSGQFLIELHDRRAPAQIRNPVGDELGAPCRRQAGRGSVGAASSKRRAGLLELVAAPRELRGDVFVVRRAGGGEALIEVGGDSEIVAHPGAQARLGERRPPRARHGTRRHSANSTRTARTRSSTAASGGSGGAYRCTSRSTSSAIDQALRGRGNRIAGRRRLDEPQRQRRPHVGQRDGLTADDRQRALDQLAGLRAIATFAISRTRAARKTPRLNSAVATFATSCRLRVLRDSTSRPRQNAWPSEMWNTVPRSRTPLLSICAIEVEAEIDAQRTERRSVAHAEAGRRPQLARLRSLARLNTLPASTKPTTPRPFQYGVRSSRFSTTSPLPPVGKP